MLYRFEGYTLDLKRGCLRAADREIELRPKSFAVLGHLVENAGRLVPREEIATAVWAQAVVTDESLARCISDVRIAIADHEHKIIKTVPRRGYLFAAEAIQREPIEASAQRAALHGLIERALSDKPSIAVLPFANLGDHKRYDYFGDGIAEDIITELSRFSELLVIARNSSFHYKGKSVDVRQVGRELGVRYTLEGSFRREAGRVRINAQLIDTTNGSHRWADRYDRKLEDVFGVQDEVARTIAAVLAVHVSRVEAERALSKPPSAWQAYEYYVQAAGMLASYQSSYDKQELFGARRLLREALAIDPDYTLAHAALSVSSVSLWVHRWDDDYPWAAALDGAYHSACEAVRLAPNLAQAHAALGWALIWRRQHEASIAEYERATALNPNFTNSHVGMSLMLAGEPERAIQSMEAHMRLDPFYGPTGPGILGLALYMLRRHDEALPYMQQCVMRAPNMRTGRVWLAANYAQMGEPDKAKAVVDEILRILPSYRINQSRIAEAIKRPEDRDHYLAGLRKAGLPEIHESRARPGTPSGDLTSTNAVQRGARISADGA